MINATSNSKPLKQKISLKAIGRKSPSSMSIFKLF